jgi:hypothetical protein
MRPYVDWSFMVGAFGLLAPPIGLFVAGIVGAILVSAVFFCVWFAILVWAWYDDGPTAFLRLMPSLLMVLGWPGLGVVLMIICRYGTCS